MVALLAEKILLQSKQYSAENTKNTIVHKVPWLLGKTVEKLIKCYDEKSYDKH